MNWRAPLLALTLAALPVTALAQGQTRSQAQADEAASISNSIFGSTAPADYAFGAFQRGYFLTALELALPRAEQGDAAAQTLIAEIYSKGLGVAQNTERAAGWYQLAAKNGDRLAIFELGMLYQDGTGVTQDRKKAAELFHEAADKGYAPAKYNLALLHVEGVYADPSLTTAAALMTEAADADLAEAQYDYGSMLIEGAGVAPDATEGARYIGLAAEQDLTAAQIDYATLLYLGQGVARDIEAAAGWYQQAAEGGNPVAQNRLAKLVAVGEGTALDLETAAMWRALARRQGLSDPSLDRLLVSIPPDALARAEERARFWPSSPPSIETVAEVPTTPEVYGPPLPAPTDMENAPSRVVLPNGITNAKPPVPAAVETETTGPASTEPAQDP
jgi:TPR repeat protein